MLLESAQAGLSWSTILKKREAYRKAFDNFDVQKISRYDEEKLQQLFTNSSIIRNKLKIRSVVKNANAFIKVQNEFGSFDSYLWSFVDGVPIQNNWNNWKDVPFENANFRLIEQRFEEEGFYFCRIYYLLLYDASNWNGK